MSNLISKHISISKYEGHLSVINSIRALIKNKYEKLFFAVILHGSVATDEVIPYSDFDGLLIVKDQYFNSKELAKFKIDSMRIILKFDPLQHHGWFQIKESDLINYPQYYLPVEILEHSKHLFPREEKLTLSLNIKIDENQNYYSKGLKQLISGIELQAKTDFTKMRLYDFKSFLSKLLLLPSMYYAAKYNKGIFKKFSFDAVRQDFSDEAWYCIDLASDLRLNWNYEFTMIQKVIMTVPYHPFRRLTKMLISPKLDTSILNKMDATFLNSLQVFINTINKDIFVAR